MGQEYEVEVLNKASGLDDSSGVPAEINPANATESVQDIMRKPEKKAAPRRERKPEPPSFKPDPGEIDETLPDELASFGIEREAVEREEDPDESATRATSEKQPVDVSSLPEVFRLPNGQIVTREEFAGVAGQYDDIRKWTATNTQRAQQLADMERSMTSDYAWHVRELMRNRPEARNEIESIIAKYQGNQEGVTTQQKISLPESLKGDQAAEAAFAQMELLRENLQSQWSAEKAALLQEMQQGQQTNNMIRQKIGEAELKQRHEAMLSYANKAGIRLGANELDEIYSTAENNRITLFNGDNPSAFTLWLGPKLLKQQIQMSKAPSRTPNTVLPSRGSGAPAQSPMNAEQMKFYKWYQDAAGDRASTDRFKALLKYAG